MIGRSERLLDSLSVTHGSQELVQEGFALIGQEFPGCTMSGDDAVNKKIGGGHSGCIGGWPGFGPLGQVIGRDDDILVSLGGHG